MQLAFSRAGGRRDEGPGRRHGDEPVAPAPRPGLQVEVTYPEPALAEIVLVNAGPADAPCARNVRVEWKDDKLLAADGLRGGFTWA